MRGSHYFKIECSSDRYELFVCTYCGETSVRDFRKAPPDSAQRPCGGSGGQSPPAPANGALPREEPLDVGGKLEEVWPVDNMRSLVSRCFTISAVSQLRESSPTDLKTFARGLLELAPIRAKLLGALLVELADEPWPRVEEGASS